MSRIISTKEINITVYEILKQTCCSAPDEIVYEKDNKKITGRELLRRVDNLANNLQKTGIKKGKIIPFYCDDLIKALYTLYAASKIGAVVKFIPNEDDIQLLENMINHYNSNIVIADQSNFEYVSNLKNKDNISNLIIVEKQKLPIIDSLRVTSFRKLVRTNKEKDLPISILSPNDKIILKEEFITSRQMNNNLCNLNNDQGINFFQKKFTDFNDILNLHQAICTSSKSIFLNSDSYIDLEQILYKIKPRLLFKNKIILNYILSCSNISQEDITNIKLLMSKTNKEKYYEIINKFDIPGFILTNLGIDLGYSLKKVNSN